MATSTMQGAPMQINGVTFSAASLEPTHFMYKNASPSFQQPANPYTPTAAQPSPMHHGMFKQQEQSMNMFMNELPPTVDNFAATLGGEPAPVEPNVGDLEDLVNSVKDITGDMSFDFNFDEL